MSLIFRITLLTLTLLMSFILKSQELDSIPRKQIHINKIYEAPKIDGVLDDLAWENAPIAKDFIERSPKNGNSVPDSLRTEVKIIYDDLGIYFGATMYDPSPEKIPMEITERDQVGNADFIYFLVNGYNDRQQSFQFLVSSAGIQYDSKITNGREDGSWNGVWYSAVKITDFGWVAEIFIPYSELRFPQKEEQIWGLNIERELKRTRQRFIWSHVDNRKGSMSFYDGEVYGIKDIAPPTRLSFQPYVVSYYNSYDGESEVKASGGMDLKYGINDAFTLDLILIPDFGQTRFDNTVLNLSAFEVQYSEQRPFFTEGTELFNKGDLFYSRRVGGNPSMYPNLAENEEIVSMPGKVDLINALKVSGRTSKNLGIGIFNAITEKTYAKVINTETGESRKELVEPLTNYNVLVLDQRFGQNNSVSFVNTNTIREGNYRDANVSGVYFDITNKANTWRYWGNTEASWVKSHEDLFGMEGSLNASKISGENRLQAGIIFRTKDYNISDLGYTGSTNFINYFGYYGYRYLQPKGFLNNMSLNFNLNYTRRLDPDMFFNANFNFNSSFTTKKFFYFGGGFETSIVDANDIYEPRVANRHVVVPNFYDVWGWISTDYRKKMALDLTIDWYKYEQKGRGRLIFNFAPRWRITDKWKLYWISDATFSDKEQGYVSHDTQNIYFGERDRNTFENRLESNYLFNDKMSLSIAFRHYYTEVAYDKYFTLEENGKLTPFGDYGRNHDTTFNNWNMDLRFSWWFAPGSQLTFLYRNSIESYKHESGMNFNSNFDYLFDQPQLNSISLRVSYYLDYNRVKNWFKKKPERPDSDHRISYHEYKSLGPNRV